MKNQINNILFLSGFFLSIIFYGCNDTGTIPDSKIQTSSKKHYTLDEFGNIESTEISIEDFSPATDCKECHESHYEEWSRSMHSYAMKDPIFFSGWNLEQHKRLDTGERFCIQCHNPVSFVTGYVPGEYFEGDITADLLQESSLPEVIKEGVGCNFCHSMTGLSPTIHTKDIVAAVA